MKNKKIIAWSTLFILLINMAPANLLANTQNPLSLVKGEGIRKIEVKHTAGQNERDISPDVSVEWSKPAENSMLPDSSGDNTPVPEYYKFELTDILNNGGPIFSTRIIGENNTSGTIQKYVETPGAFVNGKLYKLRVIPYHTHEIKDAATGQLVRIDEIGPGAGVLQPEVYFITDLNTKLKDDDGKLEIAWEYIPGATYQIVYAQGNMTEKEDLVTQVNSNVTAKPGTSIMEMTDAEARKYLVQDNGQKVKFVVPDSKPGEIYSAYVIVTDIQSAKVPKTNNIHINYDTPKIAQATTSVVLSVTNISKDKIRLEWNLGDWLAVDTQLKLTKTTIYQKLKSEGGFKNVGSIQNDGKDAGYYIMAEPKEEAEYYVEFIAEDKDDPTKQQVIKTKVVPYVPYQLRVKPLPPQVPKPYNQKSAEDDIKGYLVNGDDIDPASPALIDNTFHVADINPINLQFIWGAPKKVGLDEVDYDILHDIWIGEDQTQIRDIRLQPLEQNVMMDPALKNNLILKKDKIKVVGFKWFLKNYTKLDGTITPLLPNKTYYIKIVAKRSYGRGVFEESDPTIVMITLDKNGDIFTPPVIGKPPLKLHKVTTNTATMRWLETWAEVMPKDTNLYTDPQEKFYAGLWNSKIFTQMNSAPYNEAPYIRFKKLGEPSNENDIQILKTNADLERVKNIVNTNAGTDYYSNNFIDRIVTLGSDTKYETKVLPYDEVALKLGVDTSTTTSSIIDIDGLGKWLIENESSSTSGWATINPVSVLDAGLPAKEYLVPGLKSNTRYIIMIRAYRVLADGTKLMQTFPSYVLCTTLSDFESPETVPKVPVLNLVNKSDTSITVKWIYNKDFDYEIVYGRLQNPDTATRWQFKISSDPQSENYVSDGAEAQVEIKGLIPETTYNIWIRAKQKKGTQVSAWSNPVTAKTDILGTPVMPTGLGPAAYQSILELGQDFPPVAKDYITVEWIKNPNDTGEADQAAQMEKQYSYVVEFADNPEFLDATVCNTSGGPEGGNNAGGYEILAKNIVRFNGLIANRPYYVKVKTVLTFKDTEGNREIIKESDYTKWVRILTKSSSDEYDGGENDNIIIYPDAITESYTNDIWTIEIVDTAKIISEILKKKDYFFTIKAEKYNNRHDAAIRRIKIPKSVIDALINQRMELKLVTNRGIYEIPAKALAIYTSKYSAKDIVQFEFTKIIDYKIINILRQYPETLLKAEQLDIIMRGKTNTTVIKKLDGYARVKIKLDAAKEYLYKDLFAYTYNADSSSWVKENYSIDTLTDTYISYLTPITGIYSVYQKVNQGSTSASTFAMNSLSNTYGISGLGTVYRRNNAVNRNQFIQLLLGIAQNKPQIDLALPVSTDTLSKARAAGLYTDTGTGTINQEQAIAGVIKLYELKNGFKVKPSNVKFNNVTLKYQEAVSKAYAIGLIESINPKQAITYEILGEWLLQVTE